MFDDLILKPDEATTSELWELAEAWLAEWRNDHPDDDREDMEIWLSEDYQAGGR